MSQSFVRQSQGWSTPVRYLPPLLRAARIMHFHARMLGLELVFRKVDLLGRPFVHSPLIFLEPSLGFPLICCRTSSFLFPPRIFFFPVYFFRPEASPPHRLGFLLSSSVSVMKSTDYSVFSALCDPPLPGPFFPSSFFPDLSLFGPFFGNLC